MSKSFSEILSAHEQPQGGSYYYNSWDRYMEAHPIRARVQNTLAALAVVAAIGIATQVPEIFQEKPPVVQIQPPVEAR